jgi:hypothetical protein
MYWFDLVCSSILSQNYGATAAVARGNRLFAGEMAVKLLIRPVKIYWFFLPVGPDRLFDP